MQITKQENQYVISCSQYVKSSCRLKETIKTSMSSINSPEKTDPKTRSAVVKTSTHFGKVKLNVVLNRVQNQPPSVSSDSDKEILPPDKIFPKKNEFEKTQHHCFIPASILRIVLFPCA